MALYKCKLGELIEELDNRNTYLDFGEKEVRGVNNLKQFMPTKVDVSSRDLTKFQIVKTDEFVFNHRTSRNGSKFSIAYNDGNKPVICTEDYVVFRIKPECKEQLLAYWLYIFFNRAEFDRYVITNSWGSSTEFYNWEDLCNIEIPLPPLPIQQKYVDIYKAMVANQQAYERGLEDLKLTCTAYIENLRRENITSLNLSKIRMFRLGELIEQRREKYDGVSDLPVRGVSKNGFIDAKQPGADTRLYNTFYLNDFVFNPARMELNSIELNSQYDKAICSSLYEIFYIKDTTTLLPIYLNLFIKRSEFARLCRFVGFGSAREYCRTEDISDIVIPVPNIKTQQSIADIYTVYAQRKSINERLKAQIRDICPILIKGSIEEARG